MGSVVTWSLDKNTCRILRNSIMPLSLDFMPSDQITNMSLNDLRRRIATHDKNLTMDQMDEPSVEWTQSIGLQLWDSGHWVLLNEAHCNF
jgi:hypothetical protein